MKMKEKIRNMTIGLFCAATVSILLTGCVSGEATKQSAAADDSLDTIIEKAKEEGEIASLGMPDTWANWVGTWNDLEKEYGLSHVDTDMSSAEELAKFESEGKNGTADIGDVGISFGPLAESKELTLPYKTNYWEEIPDWAKDDDGDWLLSYTGTISFITDKENVKQAPTSWKELQEGDYQVSVGDVTIANQAQFAVLAAAIANGGDEKDIQPGLNYYKKMAEKGRLSTVDASVANLEKGEIDVAVVWDFNGLNYRDQIDSERFEVTVPTDGSIISGYTTLINKNAPHPNAAKLAREYILSDEGQINLAKGYARPIRKVELPKEVAEKLLPEDAYEAAVPVEDNEAWNKTSVELPELWQAEVLTYAK